MISVRRIAALCAGVVLLSSHIAVKAQELFPPPDTPQQIGAVRTTEVIVVDGRLDEGVWDTAPLITNFIQKDPEQGQASTFETVVRVVYDDTALYISAICDQPRDTLRVQNLERDFSFNDNDLFGVAIDGFLDRRNSVAFQVTPRGNQRDLEVIDGTNFNDNWNARWEVRTEIHDDHWVVEMAIPWRTLRYANGAERLGLIFARNIRHINEKTSFPSVPRALTIYRMAYAGELTDLQTPTPSANLQVNPYVLSDYTSDRARKAEIEIGGELKWAITPSTVLDVTVNTDFAQAEVDRQVVNLERFSVFFPERRQFFLENANLFNASVTNWIRPFFSRTIGLDQTGHRIPLDGGLRLTSRSSEQELGLLVMRQQQTDVSPSATFGVARYSRNLSGQSRLGGMLTLRQDDGLGSVAARDNVTYTIDGIWRPNQAYGVQAMASVSHDDIEGNGVGGQIWAFYENNWLYAGWLEYYNKDYEPGVGLEILDTNYVMHSPAISFDLRSERFHKNIRSYNPGATAYIFTSSDDGDLLFGYASIRPLRLHFQSGAQVGLVIEPNWQRLRSAFSPAAIEVAPGSYDYTRYRANWASDQSAELSADVTIEVGDYFDGSLSTYSTSFRYAPLPELELIANVDVNHIRSLGIESVDKDTRVFGMSAVLAPSPRLRFSALYQRNSVGNRDSWNARMSWEYRPLSYLYLVYNSGDGDSLTGSSASRREQVILKVTYLFEV